MISARTFAGPLLVTLAYVVVYYALIANQLRVKTRLRRAYRARGETFDRYFNTDREMLAADRYVGNMLEHMPTFLLLLWLNAVFVDPRSASVAGAAYASGFAPYLPLLPHVTDRHVRSFTLAGDVAEVTAQMIELRSAGVDDIIVMPFAAEGSTIEDTITKFGSQVWPAVQAAEKARA